MLVETILLSSDDKPLENWIKEVREGFVKRCEDDIVREKVINMVGDCEKLSITTPKYLWESLGIHKNWLGVLFKATKKRFLISAQVLDNTGMKRLFRFDNRCLRYKVTTTVTVLPLVMKEGWHCLEVDLKKQLHVFYNTDFVEIVRIKIKGTCTLRRIYASNVSLSEEQIHLDLELMK